MSLTADEPRIAAQRSARRAGRLGLLADRMAPLSIRGTALAYLLVFVAIPIAAIVQVAFDGGAGGFLRALKEPATLSALTLTLETSAIMSLVNAVMGTYLAYVLVRVPFPGRGFVNALIDLPFAVPTLVTGVMLVVLFGPMSFVGRLAADHGFRIVYARPGMILALLFVTLPFVVRSVAPLLEQIELAEEEAASTLGATRWQTFRDVVLPQLWRAIATGTLLSFAKSLGEFGSIVIVSGNIPGKTLTASVLVYGEIESGRPSVAAAVSIVLLAVSFGLVLLVDAMEKGRPHAA